MSGLRIKRDHVGKVIKSLHALLAKDVLVGVPAMRAERKEKGKPVNNAEIGYWMEFGAPGANIPARPHLFPGIEDSKPEVLPRFRKAAEAGLVGNVAEVDRQLNAAGLIAVNYVRAKVNSNIAPALSERSLAARRRRGVTRENTLVDTGQYRNSITYVTRKK